MVCFESAICSFLVLVTAGVLRNVAVIVSLHLEEEDFGLWGGGLLEEGGVDELEHVVAEIVEFLLDLALVGLDDAQILLAGGVGVSLKYKIRV